jgi:hypothetical protein
VVGEAVEGVVEQRGAQVEVAAVEARPEVAGDALSTTSSTRRTERLGGRRFLELLTVTSLRLSHTR